MHTTACARLRKIIFLLLCAAVLSAAPGALAQQSVNASASAQEERADVHQALLDLTNPWTVMCIAAHPDDEDGATLTVLRRKYGAHTVTVFSTYGEGGQNAIGPELYEELGAIRARETLAAALIQGSEPSFLALRDFGFSKSADEAFRIWGHDEALRRMVLKIRTLHPDVIITNHDTTSGHGHHQATGRLVLEAFDAAADQRRFPEQLSEPGVSVWQAQRLFVRVNYENGTGSKAEEDAAERAGKVVVINPNERDAVRGTTYAEQALKALHQHASQGPWPATVPQSGAPVIRYRLAREAKAVEPLPQQPKTFLDGLSLSQNVTAKLAPPTIEGQPLFSFIDQRGRILNSLLAAYKQSLIQAGEIGTEAKRFALMRDRQEAALRAAAGIKFILTTNDKELIPNRAATFTITVANQGEKGFYFKLGSFAAALLPASYIHPPPASAILMPGKSVSQTFRRKTPAGLPLNIPRAEHLYDGRLFGQKLAATATVKIDGVTFPLVTELKMDVTPAIEIANVTPSPLVLTPATVEKVSTFTVQLINHQNVRATGIVSAVGLNAPARSTDGRLVERNWSAQSLPRFRLKANETQDVILELGGVFNILDFERSRKHPIPHVISLKVNSNKVSERGTARKIHVAYADARVVPNLRVGYVRSFDDTLRNALAALGVEARELSVDEVRAGELKNFDTIIIDNRGYQAHPELVAANARLLEYARNGGTLIVCYHKANEWNPDPQKNRPQLAPYPITLGNARITDETAPVIFTESQSALLNFPNKIEAKDFDGWIQERGLYYPKEWDAHYSAPLASSDAGEAPLRGGLLAADYGRGRYIYTSMVWYRQLRAGVPGAYRVFANMLSYGHAGAKGN